MSFLCNVSLASQQSCSCSCQPLAPSSSTPSAHTPLSCQSVSCTPAQRTWRSWRRTHFSFSPSAAWRLDTPSACLRCFCCHRHEHTWVRLASVSVRSDERPCASTVLVLSESPTHTFMCAHALVTAHAGLSRHHPYHRAAGEARLTGHGGADAVHGPQCSSQRASSRRPVFSLSPFLCGCSPTTGRQKDTCLHIRASDRTGRPHEHDSRCAWLSIL